MSHEAQGWLWLLLCWFTFGVWPATVDAIFALRRGRREWRSYREAIRHLGDHPGFSLTSPAEPQSKGAP